MSNANVVNLPVKARLRCQECGAPGEGSCHCGAPYVSAGKYSALAVQAPENRGKSDRAIAEEIGVSQPTISRARAKLAATDTNVSVDEPRTGRDGRTRRLPQRAKTRRIKNKQWKPKTGAAGVNDLIKELESFLINFQDHFTAWREANPSLDEKGKFAVMGVLDVCSRELDELARELS